MKNTPKPQTIESILADSNVAQDFSPTSTDSNPDRRYEMFTLRNKDYVTADVQDRIRNTRVLVAGCGLGSTFAESAVRLGFEKFILVDGDTVAPHNLNRQTYEAVDVNQPKVEALARRLRAINPDVEINAVHAYLDEKNTAELVGRADIVFDTVDFLDLPAIVRLHDESRRQGKPIVTALAAGWGAIAYYSAPHQEVSCRELFGLPAEGSVSQLSYLDVFKEFLMGIKDKLDPSVLYAVSKALTIMADGKPCPASQVAPGAFAVGSLAGAIVYRIVAGLPVKQAPEMIYVNLFDQIANKMACA